jgi:dTDP-4-dehydrorhamnose reductase
MQKLSNIKDKINILIFGKNGQVAWELRATLSTIANVVSLGRPDIDLSNPIEIRKAISDVSPDVIINAAAYTMVDKAEKEFSLAKKINYEAPSVMAEEAKKRNITLIHYSTDYVFDGTKRSLYLENDSKNPIGAYAITKHMADMSIESSGCNHLIFRTSWVYGTRGNNFLLTMQRLAKNKEYIKVVSDQIGCPTWSRLVAEVTSQALLQTILYKNIKEVTGTYHLCSSGCASWYDFAQAIIELIPK